MTHNSCADCAHFHVAEWCAYRHEQVDADATPCDHFVPAAPSEDYRWREENRRYLRDAQAARARGDKLAFDLAMLAFATEEEARLEAKAWRMENGYDT